MNIALILFTIGIIMIVAGYTNQISPQCNDDIKVKIVSRNVYDEILYNQELTDQAYKDQINVNQDEDINDDNELVNEVSR
jgi:hypothetical protein